MRMLLVLALVMGGCCDNGGTATTDGTSKAKQDGWQVDEDAAVEVDRGRTNQDATSSADTGSADTAPRSDGPRADGTTASKGTPQNCEADKYFCFSTQMRHCTASGRDSVLVSDCASYDIADVKYTCRACPTGGTLAGLACEANKPLITGSATGVASFTYSYQPGCNDAVSASISVNAGLFHTVTPVNKSVYQLLTVSATDFSAIPSGTAVPLNPRAGQPKPVAIFLYTAGGKGCYNYALNSAPAVGSVTITRTGTTRGSQMTISVSGHLSCDSGTSWEAFTYTATGIVS